MTPFKIIFILILIIFPVVIISYLILYLNQKFKHKNRNNRFLIILKNQPLIHVLIISAIALLTVNLLFTEPSFNDPKRMIEYGKKRNIPGMVKQGYEILLLKDFQNPAFHYNRIKYHFAQNKQTRKGKKIYLRNDNEIFSFYNYLIYNSNDSISNLGHLGHAFCLYYQKKYSSAIFYAKKHCNEHTPCVNYLIGSAYLKIGQYNMAESYLLKELHIEGGFYSDAVIKLANLYSNKRRIDNAAKIIYSPQYRKYINYSDLKRLAYLNQDYKGYFKYFFLNIFHHSDPVGWLAALLICFAWIYYLWYIDIFKREKWGIILSVLLLGAILSSLVNLITLFIKYDLNFTMNNSSMHDLLYMISCIGIPEELIKIIPLLILLIFTNYIKEPYDYILYASVSALGFSLIENFIYFDSTSIHIIHGRALISVVGHMFNSSLIAYGLILSKFRKKIKMIPAFFLYFLLSALIHGFYNFILIRGMQFIFVIFYVSIIRIWGLMINNTLNNSQYFDYRIRLNTRKLQFYIVTTLSGILIFEYISLGWIYGPDAANTSFLNSSLAGSIIIFFLATRLSRFDLMKKHWSIINFRINPFFVKYRPLNFVGYTILIRTYYSGNKTEKFLKTSVTGKIVNRVIINNTGIWRYKNRRYEKNWFLVKLENPISLNTYIVKFVLLKFRSKNANIDQDNDLIGKILIPKHNIIADSDIFYRDDLKLIGNVIVNKYTE